LPVPPPPSGGIVSGAGCFEDRSCVCAAVRERLGLRLESLELGRGGLPARVEVGDEPTRLVARTEARGVPARGEAVTLRVRPDEAHLFDAESGARLGG
jgi:hypothetical protein